MDIESLRSFLAVAQYANFTRASEQLHITQPTLSRRIQGLERELGVSLFERGTQKATLTESGQIAQREALEIVQRWENLPQLVSPNRRNQSSQTLVGTLRIGHQRDIDDTVLMRIIHALSKRHPGIKVNARKAMPPELKADLAAQRCDAVFYLEPPIHTVDSPFARTLATSQMQLIVPRSHPFFQRESVCIRELEHESFILLDRKVSPAVVDFVNSVCIVNGFSIHADHYVIDAASGLAIVAAGKGIAFAHSMAQEPVPHITPDMHLVRIEDVDLSLDYGVRIRTDLPEDLKTALLRCIDEFSDVGKAEDFDTI